MIDSSYLDFLVAISIGLGAAFFASDACQKTLTEKAESEAREKEGD